jgi:hypothetical protein
MKRARYGRWMGAALAAVVLAASVARVEAAEEPTLGAMPEPPLMVFRIPSMTALGEALDGTRVAEHVERSPLLSSALDAWGGGVRFAAALLGDMSQETLERLLSREVAVAVFAADMPDGAEPPAALLMHLGEDAAMVRDILKTKAIPRIQAGNPRISVTEERLGALTVAHIQDGPKDAYIGIGGDLLAVGDRRALAKLAPAAASAGWTAFEARPEGLASSYFNLPAIWERALASAPPHERDGLRAAGLTALGEVWGATEVLAGGFKDTVAAEFGAGEGGFLAAFTELEAGASRAASVVPDDYALLVSCQIESGEAFYSLLEEIARQTEGEVGVQNLRRGMDQIDQFFAVNVEWEILPAIGNEAFFAIKAPEAEVMASGRKPLPRDLAPVIGFAVTDRAALKDVVERLAASPEAAQNGWQLITQGHGEAEYHTVRNMGGPMGFAFAFTDGFVVACREADMLKPVLDAVASGETLASEPSYARADEHLPKAAHVLAYVDTSPFRQAAALAMERNAPPKARAFLPLFQEAMPDLGGYGLALRREGDRLMAEGYGDLPAAYGFFTFGALGGAIESQKQAAAPAPPARP